MKLPEFKELIATGEGLHMEFKESRDRLTGSFFDTVCAFLNTDGGTIYLGVGDNGAVTGVEPRAITRIELASSGWNRVELGRCATWFAPFQTARKAT